MYSKYLNRRTTTTTAATTDDTQHYDKSNNKPTPPRSPPTATTTATTTTTTTATLSLRTYAGEQLHIQYSIYLPIYVMHTNLISFGLLLYASCLLLYTARNTGRWIVGQGAVLSTANLSL